MTRISPTLTAKGGKICCSACDHALVSIRKSWKEYAAVSVVPVKELPGAGAGLDERVVLRRFACPNCFRLLDTETALPEDPYLEDIVSV
jgi:acetone carboxylase gamma subunit